MEDSRISGEPVDPVRTSRICEGLEKLCGFQEPLEDFLNSWKLVKLLEVSRTCGCFHNSWWTSRSRGGFLELVGTS